MLQQSFSDDNVIFMQKLDRPTSVVSHNNEIKFLLAKVVIEMAWHRWIIARLQYLPY